MKAYVLIKTVDGSAAVSEILRSMPGIESVEEVSGALDAEDILSVIQERCHGHDAHA